LVSKKLTTITNNHNRLPHTCKNSRLCPLPDNPEISDFMQILVNVDDKSVIEMQKSQTFAISLNYQMNFGICFFLKI